MTNTTQSFDPAPFVCVNCGHEHHYEDDTILCEGKVFCEDVAACEARGFVVDEPEDPGIDSAPAHLDGDPVEDGRWYDYDDGEYEREYD